MKNIFLIIVIGIQSVVGSQKGFDELYGLYGKELEVVKVYVLGKMKSSEKTEAVKFDQIPPDKRTETLASIENYLQFLKLLGELDMTGENGFFDYPALFPGFIEAWTKISKKQWTDYDPTWSASNFSFEQQEKLRFLLADRFVGLGKTRQLGVALAIQKTALMRTSPPKETE